MKYKVVLGIICVVAIAGGVYYIIAKSKKKDAKDGEYSGEKSSDIVIRDENDSVSIVSSEDKDFNDIKNDTAEKIYERHEEAGKIIKESVERVFVSSEENRETKNTETKNKMLEELSNM